MTPATRAAIREARMSCERAAAHLDEAVRGQVDYPGRTVVCGRCGGDTFVDDTGTGPHGIERLRVCSSSCGWWGRSLERIIQEFGPKSRAVTKPRIRSSVDTSTR